MSGVSVDRMEKALAFLATTDVQSAELKAEVRRKEYIAKKARARVFLKSQGNNEERKAQAEISDDVGTAEEELAQSEAEFEKLKAKRVTESLLIDVWRSLNAARRQGQV